MPTLNWIGKEAVVKHHKDVPFRLLEPVAELSCANPSPTLPLSGEGVADSSPDKGRLGGVSSGNLIVQGDNLHALKALLPRYAGQVKCIYIDPPYNTGNEGGDGKGWTYNDNVNSHEIRAWISKAVGGESEDLTRHDKWLCMMYPRLQMLRHFLRDDGLIFVSMDESEIGNLRLLMDEIFGRRNFLATLVWKSRRNKDSRHGSNVSVDHEYVLCYQRNSARLHGSQIDVDKYANPDSDSRGAWMSDNLIGLATIDRRPNLHYDLINPGTGVNYGCPEKGWRYSRETMAEKIRDHRVIWPAKESGRPRHKKFLEELRSESTGLSTLIDCGNTNEGTEIIRDVMGENVFMFPKPLSLIQLILQQATDHDSLVLDSFAGSGTTGHAVLKQNTEDGGNRRFILIEMDDNIARNVTAERVRRVAQGYTNGKDQAVEGLGGGFQFCTLSKEPLFTAEGQIREDVTYAQLAEFVWFVETGSGFVGDAGSSPLLGHHEGRAIYLLYNGILKDKSVGGGNVLTAPVLDILPPYDGVKVIYATACRLGATRLAREQIVFKQTPYALGV
jgi:adenine-specific DNA-methyltransferase